MSNQTHPALDRAQRIERALNHVARAVELELADVALASDTLDEARRVDLREIGAAFVRISQLGIDTVNSLATTLGEKPAELPVQSEAILSPTQKTERVDSVYSEPGAPRDEKTPPDVSLEEPSPIPQSTPKVEAPISEGDQAMPEQRVTSAGGEKKKPQYEGEMYARIVPERQTPTMELREGMEPIPIRIISDDTIVLNGEKVVLEGDRLFIFNALMKLRDEIMTARDMRNFGFRLDGPSGSVAFSKAMGELSNELQNAAGSLNANIVKKIGKAAATKYAVNPAIQLVDERIEFDSTTDSAAEIVKKK